MNPLHLLPKQIYYVSSTGDAFFVNKKIVFPYIVIKIICMEKLATCSAIHMETRTCGTLSSVCLSLVQTRLSKLCNNLSTTMVVLNRETK
jgi:hypothetical protein